MRIKAFLIKIHPIFVRWNFYFGSALIMSLLTKNINKGKKYRVLTLRKSVFTEDVKAIATESNDFSFLLFPRLLLADYVKRHAVNYNSLNDNTYHKIMDGTVEQEKIFDDLTNLLRYLKLLIQFDVIFAGNYVYVSQQEFFRSALKAKIPIIVLYKEGLGASISMSQQISNQLYSNKHFFGNKILFYNETIQKTLIKAEIPGITKDKTHVVGIPRFDSYLVNERKKIYSKRIILFAFEPDVKAKRFLHDSTKVDDYIHRGEAFQADLIKFCINNSEFSLVVKTKSSPDARKSMDYILTKYGLVDLPNNIRVTHKDSAFSLLNSSSYIAGFLSTTLLEALMLNRNIICPYYKDLLGVQYSDFFNQCPNAVNYVKNYNAIEELFQGKKKFKLANDKEKKTILEPFMYKIDGKSSARVLDAIKQTLYLTQKI